MFTAAIGGMQLARRRDYFKIILPAIKVLRSAKSNPACVRAEMFKSGRVYFAVSIWENETEMKAFAKGGLHGKLADLAMENMKFFHNHTHFFAAVPTKKEIVAAWHTAMNLRNGEGTVGKLV